MSPLIATAAAAVALAGCSAAVPPSQHPQTTPSSAAPSTTAGVAPSRRRAFGVQILERQAADRSFSQGLESAEDGQLLESTGLVGHSSLRLLAPNGTVLRTAAVPAPLFATGLSRVRRPDGTVTGIWQLTWRNGVAVLRDPITLAERKQVRFGGEGWGLCHDAAGDRLVQSDGSTRLVLRDPESFAEVGDIRITDAEWATGRLGELECVQVDGHTEVWASVWNTDWMIRIDPRRGRVTAVADLAGIRIDENATGPDAVIGGIAAISGSDNEMWLSGKTFAHRYRVRLHPRP